MSNHYRVKMVFDADNCTRCGECLNECPELHLPLNVAKKEIQRLIDGTESKHVLAHCSSCFSCNLICPHDCKPYQLILERWNDLYKERGAPAINRLVCPTIDNNIWHMLTAFLTPEESTWIESWTSQTPRNKILLVGSYVHLLPFVIGDSKLLKHFTPIDLLDHWECGAYHYQLGYLDLVRRIAEKCKQDFIDWKIQAVVPLLDAVHWMLTNVHPNEMNVQHDFDIVNFNEWLVSQIQEGKIPITDSVKMNVTVHDNCYSKAGGGQYWAAPRKILEFAGCKIIEMKHIKKDSLCCGFGSGPSWVNPKRIVFDIMDVAQRKFQEAENTGAEALVTYCGGCLYILWAARELFGSPIDIFHLVEIVRKGIGEHIEYPKPHIRRAWDIIAIMTYHLVLSLVGRQFWIGKISLSESGWSQSKFRFLKLLRKILDVGLVRFIYRKTFKALLPILKSKREY